MSGTGGSAKFTVSGSGHTHSDTPTVHRDAEPPAAANRGDIWVKP